MLGGGMPNFSSLYGTVSDCDQEHEVSSANLTLSKANAE